MYEIVDQRVDVLNGLPPEPSRVRQRCTALELALFANRFRKSRQFLGHRDVLLDEIVEHVGDLGELGAALNGELRAGIATPQRGERAVNGRQLFSVAD